MKINDLSITFHTKEVKKCIDFYVKYFNAKVTFDCDWYVTVQFESDSNPSLFLNFMTPQTETYALAAGGTTLNIFVKDVDAEYEKIKVSGVAIASDIADHDWGDRSFTVLDPLGNALYIYSPRELKGEFKNAVVN